MVSMALTLVGADTSMHGARGTPVQVVFQVMEAVQAWLVDGPLVTN